MAMNYAKSVASRVASAPIDPEAWKLRVISCHGDIIHPACQYRAYSETGKYHYCNECGCGEREVARISEIGSTKDRPSFGLKPTKLDYPYLACPIGRPGFSNAKEEKTMKIEAIEELKRIARIELSSISNVNQLEDFRMKFLGVNGVIKGAMTLIGSAKNMEEQVETGRQIDEMRNEISSEFNAVKSRMPGPVTGFDELGKEIGKGIANLRNAKEEKTMSNFTEAEAARIKELGTEAGKVITEIISGTARLGDALPATTEVLIPLLIPSLTPSEPLKLIHAALAAGSTVRIVGVQANGVKMDTLMKGGIDKDGNPVFGVGPRTMNEVILQVWLSGPSIPPVVPVSNGR